MKAITTLICILIAISSYAVPNKVFDKLSEVNKCWTEQTDIHVLNYPEYIERNDREWIRIHLELVEQTLRSRSTVHLTQEQKANRQAALDHLNEYWHTGAFPINDKYAERTPIFIDDYDNFCAVGYLVKATGHEDVSRMIASKTNLAYVREMNYPELFAWADNYGFTVDELAWIQPGYGPYSFTKAIGKGTNGNVYELFVNSTNDKLFVGGDFTMVDSTINSSGVAYLTESNDVYTWHGMGSGVKGTVHTIVEFDNKIFVAGAIDSAGGLPVNNVAYWDGTGWHAAGCTYGTVYDMVIHNNELYAVGDFDVCAALPDINFAKWDTTFKIWQQIPAPLGRINTVEVINNTFYLGGKFVLQNDTMTAIKWDVTNGYTKFNNTPENEVTDFQKFDNDIYVTSKQTDTTNIDTILHKLNGNTWETAYYMPFVMKPFMPIEYAPTYNTMCVDNDTLLIGGLFLHGGINFAASQVRRIAKHSGANDFSVDSTINKIVKFKNAIIAGGLFRKGNQNDRLNGICTRVYNPTAWVSNVTHNNIQFSIYPNPAKSNITIENNFNASELRLYDIQGRLISSYTVESKKTTIALPEIAAGTYIAEISNAEGLSATERLIIE